MNEELEKIMRQREIDVITSVLEKHKFDNLSSEAAREIIAEELREKIGECLEKEFEEIYNGLSENGEM